MDRLPGGRSEAGRGLHQHTFHALDHTQPHRALIRPRELRPPRWGRFPWATWSTERLLHLRIKDLGLTIEGTWLEPRIDALYETLERRGFRLRPHIWLSEEWFSPEGVPGFAIPFYLAHPRLMRLEREPDARGRGRHAGRVHCSIMRHEAGHAIQHAYQLQRRRRWQRALRKVLAAYPGLLPPEARRASATCMHLDCWYAQSSSRRGLRRDVRGLAAAAADVARRYAGWPALRSSSTSTS